MEHSVVWVCSQIIVPLIGFSSTCKFFSHHLPNHSWIPGFRIEVSCASVEGSNLSCDPFSSYVGAFLTSLHHSTCVDGPDWTEAKCLLQSPNWEFHVWLRLWLHFLRVHVVYSGTHMCTHDPIWRPEDNLSCHSSTAVGLAFWDIIFHWLGDHQVGYAGSLVSAKDPSVFVLPMLGLYAHCNPMTGFFMWVLET